MLRCFHTFFNFWLQRSCNHKQRSQVNSRVSPTIVTFPARNFKVICTEKYPLFRSLYMILHIEICMKLAWIQSFGIFKINSICRANLIRESTVAFRAIGDKYPEYNITSFYFRRQVADQMLIVLPNTVQNVCIAIGAFSISVLK